MKQANSYPAWIDLHLHLDGSISLKTARKLAGMQSISLPDSHQALQQRMSVIDGCKDLNDYLNRFQLPISLLHIREALYLCTYELLDELYEQGLRYAEIRFAPQLTYAQELRQYDAVQVVLRAIEDTPLPCGLILSMMRGSDNHIYNMKTIEVAKQFYGKGVVAVDLAGAEALYPTHTFREEFAAVRAAGIPLIVHAGEAAGPQSVREAVEAGAVRIGHGVRSLEDPEVIKMLVEKKITLELCPTSNLHTGIYKTYKEYPLRQLMEKGVRVCLNTDNMTVSNTTLLEEWQHMMRAFHLTEEEKKQIVRNSIEASFAPQELKKTLLAELN
ncbi:MAG: adenosine deaminase [Paludibacteraceae bacterium]|nr:adenosine deaminase [Paludibacteraceae bacterium]MBR1381512.1 adenosine deaminase [Paludibacteraceae bacterium]